MAELAHFHFLRPAWLMLLPVAALIIRAIRRHTFAERRWRGVIAPHLLNRLLVSHDEHTVGPTPELVLAIAWFAAIVAVAGPAWQRQPSPFGQNQAALVVALKVTPEMLAEDIRPTRLQRAVFKIRDLLAARPDGRTALLAYAGSAHLVVPLTVDTQLIATFAAELDPQIMPLPGDAAAEAVALANRLLTQSGVSGSVLLVADSVDATQLEAIGAQRQAGGAPVHVLAVAAGADVIPPPDSPPAPALDRSAMRATARAGGGVLQVATVDSTDVGNLSRAIATRFARAPAGDAERWRDEGYWLSLLSALSMLLLFRRGGAAGLE